MQINPAFYRLHLYLPLIVIFFVLHGYLEHHRIVLIQDAVRLCAVYLLVASALFFLFYWLFHKQKSKAALFSFSLLFFNFFFGALHDGIKTSGIPWIHKYSVLLPIVLAAFILLFIYLRRTKIQFSRGIAFLNICLTVLILLDAVLLLGRLINRSRITEPLANSLAVCVECPKPDIYLIVADSYPGNLELKEKMNFDNIEFLESLRSRGFYIADSSTGNYNMTTACIAALLNMSYVPGIAGTPDQKKRDLEKGYDVIRNGSVPSFLRAHGYKIFNHSIFDLKHSPAFTEPTFLPRRVSNITSQTFVNRLLTNLGFHLIEDLNLEFIHRYVKESDYRNNQKILSKTRNVIGIDSKVPQFVYAHFVMPHYPYYFDSMGKKLPLKLLSETYITNTESFISYLKYANKILISLIDDILRRSKQPPIIILMGDHGFREFPIQVENKYHFMNLLSVYYPSKDYSSLYPSISNVNLFRVLFNDYFRQKLPILKDSTRYLLETEQVQ